MLARDGGPHIIRPVSSLTGRGRRRSSQTGDVRRPSVTTAWPNGEASNERTTIRRRRAEQISASARAVAQRTPATLTLVRHRAQPTAETIVRLTVTAVFAYLIAMAVPGTSHSVLAPLTALLVAQVSLYQTLRSAVSRVAAVVAGVLLAVGLAALVGFMWWSLGITTRSARPRRASGSTPAPAAALQPGKPARQPGDPGA
jgi:aromatic acid exporter family member 1